MTLHILHLDSSPGDKSTSYSRRISAAIVEALAGQDDDAEVTYRDLAQSPPPHINGALRAGWVSPADARTPEQVETVTRSEGLIAELKRANAIVIGAPMYNLTVPSTLKAWIDHVAIAGQTFRYTPEGRPEGLLSGQTAYVGIASGGIYSRAPRLGFEHLETYLRAILGLLGIRDVRVVRAEGVGLGPDRARQALADALARAEAIAGGEAVAQSRL